MAAAACLNRLIGRATDSSPMVKKRSLATTTTDRERRGDEDLLGVGLEEPFSPAAVLRFPSTATATAILTPCRVEDRRPFRHDRSVWHRNPREPSLSSPFVRESDRGGPLTISNFAANLRSSQRMPASARAKQPFSI